MKSAVFSLSFTVVVTALTTPRQLQYQQQQPKAGATSTSRRHPPSILTLNMVVHRPGNIRASAATDTIPFASNANTSFGGGGPGGGGIGENRSGGRRGRKRVTRAPAVDSALLRFVSQQQRVIQQQQQQQQRIPSSTDPTTAGNAVAARARARVKISAENKVAATPSAVASRTNTSGSSSSSSNGDAWWWGQFNCHRIVSVLVEKGQQQQPQQQQQQQLDMEAVERAGEAVQSQALARKARRQIRSFLKERDATLRLQRRDDETNGMEREGNLSGKSSSSAVSNNGVPPSPSLQQQQQQQQPLHSFEESVDVMLKLGLTVKDVVDILQHTPGVALMRPRGENGQGETLETTLTRVFQLLGDTLKLRRYDARKVIRTCPGLLTMRRSKAAEQVVIIMSKLGVSAKALSRDVPALSKFLLRPPAALFRLVSFLASDAIRMPVKQIGPLIRRRECLELLDRVAPVPTREVLMAADDTDEEDSTIIDSVDPTVASALWGRESIYRRERIEETYRRMSTTAWTLRYEIGTKDLGKVIAAYPSVLLLDAQKNILPNADYLMGDLGIWEDDLPKVLQLYPTLLGAELDDMRGVVDYMLSLDVPEENLGSIFRAFPHLLTLDVEKNMRPVVDFLQSVGISNLGRFITRLPPVLGYSVERELLPKWNYLADACADPRFEITKFPAYFSYPLQRVIKTRYEYIRRVKRMPTQFMAVDQIMSFGDEDFATKIMGDVDGGLTFKNFCERRKSAYSARGNKNNKQSAKKGQAPLEATAVVDEVPIESSLR